MDMPVLVTVAAVSVVVAVIAGLALAGTVELEFNPFSLASRARRAERAGRIGEALRLYAKAGRRDRLMECLRSALPDSPVRPLLLTAANEVVELEASAAIARAADVPQAVTDRVAEEAVAAAEVLWRGADRIAAVAAQKVESTGLQLGLKREAERLNRVFVAIQEARSGLAELTLVGSGGNVSLETVEIRLRGLADATRELRELQDEGSTPPPSADPAPVET